MEKTFKQWAGEVSELQLHTVRYSKICWRSINLSYWFNQGVTPEECIESYVGSKTDYAEKAVLTV